MRNTPRMDWPIPHDWPCDTCGSTTAPLGWMLTHGQCICTQCGTVYSMGTVDNKLSVPKNIMIDPDAVKKHWEETQEFEAYIDL